MALKQVGTKSDLVFRSALAGCCVNVVVVVYDEACRLACIGVVET